MSRWLNQGWRNCIVHIIGSYRTVDIGRVHANRACRKNAVTFSFFIPQQTSSTENVRNCLLRTNSWKSLSNSIIRRSVFIGSIRTSFSLHNFGFCWPQKCTPQLFKSFSRQNLSFNNSRFTSVIRFKIDSKSSEISQFHNKCTMRQSTMSSRFVVGSRMHRAFMLDLPILSA